jgi:hypothetical protein
MPRYVILIVLVFGSLASSSAAQSCKFNVNGDWDLWQNNGILVKISLTQTGEKVTGLASYQGMKQGRRHSENGDVTGTFYPTESTSRYRLYLEIKSDYGETGVYTGWVDKQYSQATGRSNGKWWMKGDAYIRQDPNNFARMTAWRFVKNLPCLR